MDPATTKFLLMVLIGGPTVMVGTFAVARALVMRHDKPLNQEIGMTGPLIDPSARRSESTRPPQRKELSR